MYLFVVFQLIHCVTETTTVDTTCTLVCSPQCLLASVAVAVAAAAMVYKHAVHVHIGDGLIEPMILTRDACDSR